MQPIDDGPVGKLMETIFAVGFQIVKVNVGKNERGTLVPDQDEAPIGRLVFTLSVDGLGATTTAQGLNRRGIKYRGRSLSKDDVIRVLDEEAAAGT